MSIEDLTSYLEDVHSINQFSHFVENLRIFASNNKSGKVTINLIEEAIEKAFTLDDKKSLIDLYEIKISQIEHISENIPEISKIMKSMRKLSSEINYLEGLALSYNIEWYAEKFKGNKGKSKKALDESIYIISKLQNKENYCYATCSYSLAVEMWLEKNDQESSVIFQKCSEYYSKHGYYRSLLQCLAMLIIIFSQRQEKKEAIEISKRMLVEMSSYVNAPEDIYAYIYYFVGISNKLNFNLSLAEKFFEKSAKILKNQLRENIYFAYYIPTLSNLAIVKSLKGEIDSASKSIEEVEKLMQKDDIADNLGSVNKRQLKHSFNLVKFYVKARLSNFNLDGCKNLIQEIYEGVKTNFSDAIFLIDFLLNTRLSNDELFILKEVGNLSIKRVEHIIDYLMEKNRIKKEMDSKQQYSNYAKILLSRIDEEGTTFMEKAFTDLLAAQEYYGIGCFAEIYPLLKKYEKQLHRIEVLEIRIFMEAFIQVGKFKMGDPLGPALQYMAIKKCRYYGFSRLEKRLLDYLDMQYKDIQSFIR